MIKAASDSTPYTVPQQPGRLRAIGLAIFVHVALLAFLWIGVRWQNTTPIAVEAEIWSPQAMEAAPKPQPTPDPVPEPKPEPKPIVKETPPPPEIAPKPAPVAKPDIALEEEKKRKKREEEKERAAAAQAREREEEKKQAALDKQKKEELNKKKLAEEKQKELEEKKLAEKEKLEKEKEKKLAAAAEQKRKQAEEAKEAKAADARRIAEMSRMSSQANSAATGSGGMGSAEKSQGPRGDASYIARVGAKIKSNTVFNVSDDSNSSVEYSVDLLPDGSVRSVRKLKSSGVPGFDEAVARAIDKSQPYPADKSGKVPSSFTLSHKPKDQ